MSHAPNADAEDTPNNQTNTTIGVITAIDGDTPSEDARKKWANNLRQKLGQLDGVIDTNTTKIDQYGNRYIITLTVPATTEYTYNNQERYTLNINPRSMGQRIRHVINNDTPANANIFDTTFESPNSLGNGYHDSNTYKIVVCYP